jgi:hypothetical protein
VRETVRCSVIRSYNFALQPSTLTGTVQVLTKTIKTDRPTDRRPSGAPHQRKSPGRRLRWRSQGLPPEPDIRPPRTDARRASSGDEREGRRRSSSRARSLGTGRGAKGNGRGCVSLELALSIKQRRELKDSGLPSAAAVAVRTGVSRADGGGTLEVKPPTESLWRSPFSGHPKGPRADVRGGRNDGGTLNEATRRGVTAKTRDRRGVSSLPATANVSAIAYLPRRTRCGQVERSRTLRKGAPPSLKSSTRTGGAYQASTISAIAYLPRRTRC